MDIALSEVGVLSTIMPIGLLILGFEVRSMPSMVATGRSGTFSLWLLGRFLLLALVTGFFAEYRMVLALLASTDVVGFDVVIVRTGFFLVGMTSFWLLAGSLAHKLGLLERLGRRSARRTMSSPRRLARQIEYVEKHHPNWRDAE